jgi:SAM-dependent methyltransferase
MCSLKSLLRDVYHIFPTPPSTNFLYRDIVPNPYSLVPKNPTVFDIGSKDAKATYAFGSPPPGSKVVCVDREEGRGVDLVADAHNLVMVADDSVDLVLCIDVLNYVKYPPKVMDEIFRILKPGGIIYINVPFIHPLDQSASDLHRFSYKGLAVLCENFECVDSGFNRGPASTMHHLMVHFMAILFCFNSTKLYGVNIDIFKWLLFWVKYLDKIVARYDVARVIHNAAYYIGRKPEVVA